MSRKHTDFAITRRIGARLTEERKKRGYSVMDVARLSGLGMTTIYNAESGQYEPSLATLIALCELYTIDINLLIK